MSSSLETANQLATAARELEKARQDLIAARRAYLAAIDGELSTSATPPRKVALERAKRVLVPQLRNTPHRIVLPDMDVDPLADPEELDQRAAELRATEEELDRELDGLSAQATELDHMAQLRKHHDRAGDLFNRDDDEPHRTTAHKTDEETTDPGHGGGLPSQQWPVNIENYVPVVLSDVLDASTISTVAAAERSGDPALRAEAARKAHDAVAARVEQVRKKRVELEARARQLRAAH